MLGSEEGCNLIPPGQHAPGILERAQSKPPSDLDGSDQSVLQLGGAAQLLLRLRRTYTVKCKLATVTPK